MPNVTAPAGLVRERARFARAHGAGALLVCPGIVRFDTMRQLADDESLDLPIMSYPPFSGSFVLDPQGRISHYALYGQLQRLAGADASSYPNFGGRFSFSCADCLSIVAGYQDPMGGLKPIFATPGGGVSLSSVPEMRVAYGSQIIYTHRRGAAPARRRPGRECPPFPRPGSPGLTPAPPSGGREGGTCQHSHVAKHPTIAPHQGVACVDYDGFHSIPALFERAVLALPEHYDCACRHALDGALL